MAQCSVAWRWVAWLGLARGGVAWRGVALVGWGDTVCVHRGVNHDSATHVSTGFSKHFVHYFRRALLDMAALAQHFAKDSNNAAATKKNERPRARL